MAKGRSWEVGVAPEGIHPGVRLQVPPQPHCSPAQLHWRCSRKAEGMRGPEGKLVLLPSSLRGAWGQGFPHSFRPSWSCAEAAPHSLPTSRHLVTAISPHHGLVQKVGWAGWEEPGSKRTTLHHQPVSATHHLGP